MNKKSGSISTLTESQMNRAARTLANIYYQVTKGQRVDPFLKDRMYALASTCPQIHYEALRINNMRHRMRMIA